VSTWSRVGELLQGGELWALYAPSLKVSDADKIADLLQRGVKALALYRK
jgi:hypothetical protein